MAGSGSGFSGKVPGSYGAHVLYYLGEFDNIGWLMSNSVANYISLM